MPPQGNFSLDECYELVEEMKKMYSGDEDRDTVLSLRQWHEDIYTTFDAREEHMAKLIRGERRWSTCDRLVSFICSAFL